MTHAKEPDDGPEDVPTPEETTTEQDAPVADRRRRVDWSRVLAYGILPGIALVLAASAGALRYVDTASRDDVRAGAAAVETAKATTVAMLSYSPDDVDQQLNAASNLLTGDFRGQYLGTIHNTVIPGSQEQHIAAVTKVPAAAVVSATEHRAVVMLYLDQTVTVDADPPTVTLSSARATLDEVGGKWLISEFTVT